MSATNIEKITDTMRTDNWSELSTDDKLDALYIAVNDTRDKLNQILIIAGEVKEKAEPVIEAVRTGGVSKLLMGGF